MLGAFRNVGRVCAAAAMLAALFLACAPDLALAAEQTDSATTEVYLAPGEDQSAQGTQSAALDGGKTAGKTGDSAPIAPIAAAGAAAAAVAAGAVAAGRRASAKRGNGGPR